VSRLWRHVAKREHNMALYALLAISVALVIYLFYAIVHPERF
jgi:K+-transporting ATPase KdpF subunit